MSSAIPVFLRFLLCCSDWARQAAVKYFHLFSVTSLCIRVDSRQSSQLCAHNLCNLGRITQGHRPQFPHLLNGDKNRISVL